MFSCLPSPLSRSSYRVWQRLAVAGLVAVVSATAEADSTRSGPGYGGVLPMPTLDDPAPDLLAGHMRDTVRAERPERGRVLYATERVSRPLVEPRVTQTAAAAPRGRRTCSPSTQAVVQTASRVAPGPNS